MTAAVKILTHFLLCRCINHAIVSFIAEILTDWTVYIKKDMVAGSLTIENISSQLLTFAVTDLPTV